MYSEGNIERLLGAKVLEIYMNEESLTFITDKGVIAFGVYGDCCSRSAFYDFYGVKNLLENGPITLIEKVELQEGEDQKGYDESIQVYGYRLTTEHSSYGPVSSVFSFRNYSNGYYGGSLEVGDPNTEAPRLTEDLVCTQSLH